LSQTLLLVGLIGKDISWAPLAVRMGSGRMPMSASSSLY
jgi:hypothetical protein